jgi:hypothetical protein
VTAAQGHTAALGAATLSRVDSRLPGAGEAALLGRLSTLLRRPEEVAARCHDGDDARGLATSSLLAIAVGGGVFGAVLGSYRGGAQIAYAAVKLPLALVATLAIAAPAFRGIAIALGRRWSMRTVVGLSLAASARSSLVLLAFAPVLWLIMDLGAGYHGAVLAAATAYAAAGLAALGVVLRALGPGRLRGLTALAMVAVFGAVGGQTAWILRPFLVRPRTVHVPFLRPIEGNFAGSLKTTRRSALGRYDREAPLPASEIEEGQR